MVFGRKSKKDELDLNNDGKFDKEDKKLAGRVLASKIDEIEEEEVKEDVVKEKPKVEEKEGSVEEEVKEVEVPAGSRVAVKDISRKYRKGDVVPEEQIALWKASGIKYEVWF